MRFGAGGKDSVLLWAIIGRKAPSNPVFSLEIANQV